jgi:hypothetical protein
MIFKRFYFGVISNETITPNTPETHVIIPNINGILLYKLMFFKKKRKKRLKFN